MELEKIVIDDCLLVRVKGELDHHWAAFLRDNLESSLEESNIKHLVLNLGGLTFMDSSGVGVLLGRYRHLHEQGGQIALCEVAKPVAKVLEISGVNKIIPFYQEEKEALNKVARGLFPQRRRK